VSMPMRRRGVMGERSNLAAAARHCKPARARVALVLTALLQKNGCEMLASTPDELTAHLKSEGAKWQRVFKERGMRAD